MNFAICVNNSGYPASLELHKTYRLLPDDAAVDGDLRVTDESGEDYLYPADYFLLVSSQYSGVGADTRVCPRDEHAGSPLLFEKILLLLEFPQDTEWVLRDSFLRRLQPAAV